MTDQHKHESKPGAKTPAMELDEMGKGLMTPEKIQATIASYESLFGMSSEAFLRGGKRVSRLTHSRHSTGQIS